MDLFLDPEVLSIPEWYSVDRDDLYPRRQYLTIRSWRSKQSAPALATDIH